MDAFFSFAALAVIKVSVLLGGAAALSLLLRRHSAALRHLVWSLAIAGVVVLPFAMATSPVTLHLLPAVQTQSYDEGADQDAARNQHAIVPDDAASVEHTSASASAAPSAAFPSDAASVTQPTFDVRAFAGIWLVGALMLLARFLGGMFRRSE